jgi:hypothetical protein
MKTILIILFAAGITAAQNVYELTPGTKNNSLTITLSNISVKTNAENIGVTLVKSPGGLTFSSAEQSITKLDPEKETDVTFMFDVERTVNITTKDTVEFLVKDGSGVYLTKSFIFSYIAPNEYKLEQNFPNPFNPVTTIQYQLPYDSRVNLRIYSILGKEVAVLADEIQPAGFKEIKFNGSSLASGVYIYRLNTTASAGSYTSTKKMLYLK